MNPDTYAFEARIEKDHWWYQGRRRLFLRMAERYAPDHDAAILDIGTSTGGTLRALANQGYRNVSGLELSPEAIALCEQQGFNQVELGDVCAMPFEDSSFDFVIASDVIEHVDVDVQAAREVRRVLKPGQYALFTVPAFQMLWSKQDDIARHKRRYRINGLRDCLQRAQFEVIEIYYFNYLLFLPILGVRYLIKLFRIDVENEQGLNAPVVNKLFSIIFNADVDTARHLRPPFGVSIFALVRR
jgi:SAM-dependent methyltransferase